MGWKNPPYQATPPMTMTVAVIASTRQMLNDLFIAPRVPVQHPALPASYAR